MTPRTVCLLWLCTLEVSIVTFIVFTTAQENDRCQDVLHLGIATDSKEASDLQTKIEEFACLNFTFLDIYDISSLHQYYLSASVHKLSLLYLYFEDCHYLAIIANWLAQLEGGPIIVVAMPYVTCPPMNSEQLFSIGPDWSKLESIINDVVSHEEADHVILLHGAIEFPYTSVLQLKLSSRGIIVTTYSVDLSSGDLSLDPLFSPCPFLCSTNISESESLVIVVAVFENDNASLAFLEKVKLHPSKSVLWLFPITESAGIRNLSLLSPNIYFVESRDGSFQSPETNLIHVVETILSHLNATEEALYDNGEDDAKTTLVDSRNECSNPIPSIPTKKQNILVQILQKYFPNADKSRSGSSSGEVFSFQHFTTTPSTTSQTTTQNPLSDLANATTLDPPSELEDVEPTESPREATLLLETSGTWSLDKGLTIKNNENLYVYDKPREGKFMIGTIEAHPFSLKGANNSWTGFAIDLTMEIMQRLGLSYELVESFDGRAGSRDATGIWNGLIRMAQLQQINLAVGPITLTPERAAVVDFVQPIMEDGGGIIVKKVEDPVDKFFSNLRPFQLEVWATLFSIVTIVAVIFLAVNYWSPYQTPKKGYESMINQCVHRVRDSVWIIFSSFSSQGVSMSPYNASGRFVLGCWWVFAILVSASYTAELAATLTLSIARDPIETLDDLAQQTDIIPIAKQGSNWYSMIEKGESETFRKLWNLMKDAPKFSAAQDGLQLVRSGGYAMITDYSQLKSYRKVDCDNLVIGTEVFNKSSLGFFVPQGSPWRKKIDAIIVKLHEAGIVEKYRKKWWSTATQCSDTERTIIQSVGLESSGGQYIIMAAIMLLAILTACAEVAWRKSSCHKRLANHHTAYDLDSPEIAESCSGQEYHELSEYPSSRDLGVENDDVTEATDFENAFDTSSGNTDLDRRTFSLDDVESSFGNDHNVNDNCERDDTGQDISEYEKGSFVNSLSCHDDRSRSNGFKHGEINYAFNISDGD